MGADVWPPYADSKLPGNGLATALVSTALGRAGYTSEYVEVPPGRVLYDLEHDQYDLVIAAWKNSEREQIGQFSEPYLTTRVLLLQRSDRSIRFETLSDLRVYRIAVMRGYRYSPQFDTDKAQQKVKVNSLQTATRMLVAGRVDLVVEDELAAKYYLAKEPQKIRDQLQFFKRPLVESGLHILVRKSHPRHEQIIVDFNRELRDMCEDGTYSRIFRQHGFTALDLTEGLSCR